MIPNNFNSIPRRGTSLPYIHAPFRHRGPPPSKGVPEGRGIKVPRSPGPLEDYTPCRRFNRLWYLLKWLVPLTSQLVSVTHEFKFESPDGKQHAVDAMAAGIVSFVRQ